MFFVVIGCIINNWINYFYILKIFKIVFCNYLLYLVGCYKFFLEELSLKIDIVNYVVIINFVGNRYCVF